jgi:NAD(P)-dependent dehydrogenase (short-subunit alcohol dehydrogenase family)
MSAGKTVFITGSSIGIGRATAELFHRNGWQVVATMRNPDAGKKLAELERVLVTRLDVTDDKSIHAAVAAAVARFGGVDVLTFEESEVLKESAPDRRQRSGWPV